MTRGKGSHLYNSLKLRDAPLEFLYWPEDVGVDYVLREDNSQEDIKRNTLEAVCRKRDEFVGLWRGWPLNAHLARREQDELFCERCHKRWMVNEEPPSCL